MHRPSAMASETAPLSVSAKNSAGTTPRNHAHGHLAGMARVHDAAVFAAGAATAVFVILGVASVLAPTPIPNKVSIPSFPSPSSAVPSATEDARRTFYDDPGLSYTIDRPISGWDAKRAEWLRQHPELGRGSADRVLMVSGSQPGPCRSPTGDHLLLRFLKNKLDYCRLHGIELFYNTALLNPSMPRYWAKIPVLRAAMVAHPEAEWLWWVDADAVFTDMDFALPLDKYREHNLVVHGWPHLVFDSQSWVSLNAGVFLIRNSQWSLDFMDEWARMGPVSPDYAKWGQVLKSTFKDKLFNESDDQSALVYLLLKKKDTWGDKIYLENEYYFQGYWLEIVGRLENISARYEAMERRRGSAAAALRRWHAERAHAAYVSAREARLAGEGLAASGPAGWRRPFVTHFTGCQPCSGEHNAMYSGEKCDEGARRALNFADNQVLRAYGFHHAGLLSDDVRPQPFDYPVAQ